MNIYVDESGDLGWTFDKPYLNGGSSRFLTIAHLIVPKISSHLPKRKVRELYRKLNQPANKELKSTKLSISDRVYFANSAVRLLTKNKKIKIVAITVRKENVWNHIRSDANKLYNYMIGLVLLKEIKSSPNITFIPDKRTIKVKSGNSLVDYLQTQLWFEHNSQTIIQNLPSESHVNLNLQFVDYIANVIWRRYELNDYKAFNILKNKIKLYHLFF